MTDTPIPIRRPDVVSDVRALAEPLGLTMTEVIADANEETASTPDAEHQIRAAEKGLAQYRNALRDLAKK